MNHQTVSIRSQYSARYRGPVERYQANRQWGRLVQHRELADLVGGTNAVSDNIPIGEFTEMHWTSLGKCVLAYLPRARRNEIIGERDLATATANTVTETGALRDELEEIREHGYSIEDEERREGIRSVAVPILSPDEDILGAIGLTGPTNRFDAEQLLDYVALLENKANVIYLKRRTTDAI